MSNPQQAFSDIRIHKLGMTPALASWVNETANPCRIPKEVLERFLPSLVPCSRIHAILPSAAGLSQVPLTFQHNSPASKEDLAEWDPRVGPRGPVLIVQAEHEGLDEGVAIAESIGEDIGDARVY